MNFSNRFIKPRKKKEKYIQPKAINLCLQNGLIKQKEDYIKYKPYTLQKVSPVFENTSIIEGHTETNILFKVYIPSDKRDFVENTEKIDKKDEICDFDNFSFNITIPKFKVHLSEGCNENEIKTSMYDFSKKISNDFTEMKILKNIQDATFENMNHVNTNQEYIYNFAKKKQYAESIGKMLRIQLIPHDRLYENKVEHTNGWALNNNMGIMTHELFEKYYAKGGKLEKIKEFFKNNNKLYLIVIDTFEQDKTAEKELMSRIKIFCSAHNINYLSCTSNGLINDSGILNGLSIKNVPNQKNIIVLSLHHSSKKISDHLTLLVLWNPVHFLQRYNDNITSYDGYISSFSENIDNYVKSLKTNVSFYGHLTTTMSITQFVNDIQIKKEPKVFYVGINWHICADNIKGIRRKSDLTINKLIQENLVMVYGPYKYWKHYKNHKGEIPFDGKSIIKYIKDSGICLVLSSDKHIDDSICSMRIFEGIAAGVPIICDCNPFFQKFFGDNVFYIDTSENIEDIVSKVKQHIQYIKDSPDIAKEKIIRCREICRNFTFEKHFSSIMTDLTESQKLNNFGDLINDMTLTINHNKLFT